MGIPVCVIKLALRFLNLIANMAHRINGAKLAREQNVERLDHVSVVLSEAITTHNTDCES